MRIGDGSRRAFLTDVAAAAAAAAMPWPSEAQAPLIHHRLHIHPTIRRVRRAHHSGPRRAWHISTAAYPERYRRLAVPLGVVGAIKVEASP